MSDRIQIFLAHASEDKQKVIEIYDRLRELGYAPWLDKKNLIPGQNWKIEIPKVIKNSDIFIACFSSNSISKTGYIQKEFKLALDKYAELPTGQIYLIPLRLENCEIPELQRPELGINLRDIHWLDFWEEDGFEILIKAIEFSQGRNPDAKLKILEQLKIKEQQPLKESEIKRESPRSEIAQKEPQKQSEEDFQKTPSESKKSLSLLVFKFDVITVNASGKEVKRDKAQAEYFTENLGNGVTLDMVAIPGGEFMMGTDDEEIERLVKKFEWDGYRREKPQHSVNIKPFFMGKFQVTQAQWRAVANLPKVDRDLNPNPSRFEGDNLPVEQVTWYDAIEFCKRLSKRTKREYRLPSEAQWEYACRGGTATPFHFGETISAELANYQGTSIYGQGVKGEYREQTTPVGYFKVANNFGLYDMHGNVWEWCADEWHDNYEAAPADGSVWLDGKKDRSPLRGGSWFSLPNYCRSAYRNYDIRENRYYTFGFRVVCGFGRTH